MKYTELKRVRFVWPTLNVTVYVCSDEQIERILKDFESLPRVEIEKQSWEEWRDGIDTLG